MATTIQNTTKVDDDEVNLKTTNGNSTGNVDSNSAKFTQNIAKTVTGLPNVSPDWTYRRKLIFMSMYFTALCFLIVVLVNMFTTVWSIINVSHGSMDMAQAGLMDTIIYALGFFASSVIGTYCFSASYEHINYRSAVMTMVSKIATSGNKTVNVVATEDKPPQ